MSQSANDILRHQGALEKQGRLQKWKWNKYWFILHDDQLIYYKEDYKSKSINRRTSSSANQGEICLSQAHCVKALHNVNHGFAFEIDTKSRTHVLSAETSESRSAWVNRLQEAMMVKNRRSVVLDNVLQSKPSCKSLGDDEGLYDPVQYGGDKGSGSEISHPTSGRNSRPPLLKDLSVNGPANCSSFLGDDYSPVFDAAPHPIAANDDTNHYAEVADAIKSKFPAVKSHPKTEENQDYTEVEATGSVYNCNQYAEVDNAIKPEPHTAKSHLNNEEVQDYSEVEVADVGKPKSSKFPLDDDPEIPAYAETEAKGGVPKTPNTLKPVPKGDHVANGKLIGDTNNDKMSYSYVQMRTRTTLDYRGQAKIPSGTSHMSATTYAEVDYSETSADTDGNVSENNNKACLERPVSPERASVPAYATVRPKTLRHHEATETLPEPQHSSSCDLYDEVVKPDEMKDGDVNEDYDSCSTDDYDYIEQQTSSILTFPNLPNPRLELTMASSFDKIRLFLAEHRGPNEVFKTPADLELGGKAVEKLEDLLRQLDQVRLRKVKRLSDMEKPPVPTKRIQSTHL